MHASTQASHTALRCTGVHRPSWRPAAPYLKPCRPSRVARARRGVNTVVVAAFAPPTVAETKDKFMDYYPEPVPAIYAAIVQELIVQQHFVRYNKNYAYDPIFALGVTSGFDQILEGSGSTGEAIFSAYIKSLDEDPNRYTKDARDLEKACSELEGLSGLIPGEGGSLNSVQSVVQSAADRFAKKEMHYNKFFAIGLFRILELTGVKDPQALGSLVNAIGIKQEAVNRDLKLYKNILTKLSAGRELMREIIEREKKKAAERLAAKAAQGEPAAEKVEVSAV